MEPHIDIILTFLPKANQNQLKITPISSGLINSTFKIECNGSGFILQKVNNYVFKNPQLIHHNYNRIKKQLLLSKYSKETISFLKAKDNDELLLVNNDCWRMSHCIEGNTYENCKSLQMAYSSAEALAEFHKSLKDIQSTHFPEPIKNFCNFSYRLIEYNKSIMSSESIRLEYAENLILGIKSNLDYVNAYIEIEKQVMKRIIHGDPKVSNFLFSNNNDKVISIIDIDTIMSGSILYDFGDMVRSFSNRSNEDYLINENSFESDVYESLKNGYLSIGKQFMMQEEQDSLGLSAMAVSLIQCIRFLTDYLNSDVYYKVTDPKQNLNRAINQFSFYKELKAYLNL